MQFEDIYRRYPAQIYRLCMGYACDQELAKDLLQETFISVWKSLGSFRGEAEMSTWIYRIAIKTCLREIGSSKRLLPGLHFG